MSPPANTGPEAFHEIRRAYEMLSDPAARARYDSLLGVFRGGGAGGVMPVWRLLQISVWYNLDEPMYNNI
uniref:J domain-containing protein n=1 Tax=Aegilops tauschii TaxID=37682 RepID=M8BQY9_AEGTA